MDNTLKKQPLARLCTNGLKRSLWGWAVQVGQGKGRIIERKTQVDLAEKRGIEEALPPFTHSSSMTWRGKLMGGRGNLDGGGIEKGFRKETGLWSGRIGEEAAQ